MLRSAILLLLLILTACGEEREEFYDSFADAQRAGAVERGWIPAFVPESARNIRERHDIDTNSQNLRFTVNPSDIPGMIAGLTPVPMEDMTKVAELRRKLGFDAPVSAHMICSKPLNGILLIDHNQANVVFLTPVAWVDNYC